MNRRITNLLNKYKSKESVDTDTYVNLLVDNKERLLPPGEINKVLDLTEQFDYERQNCPFYRILGKINPLISNVLFNTTGGDNTWQSLNTPIFTNNTLDEDDPNLTFGESIKKHLKEIDGWYGYFDPVISNARLCLFYDMEPKRERFSFTPDITNQQVKNWELTITYPYSSDKNHPMIKDGITIIDKQSVIVGGKPMTALSVPVSHNLLTGDIVRLTNTNLNGDYQVIRVGLDDGKLKNNYFCIDVEFNALALNPNTKMTKIYDNVPSEYYFRKFKKIKTKSSNVIETDDYEIFKIAFSESIFSDDITEFIFNEDITITDLVDNLGRPLSELYLTIIKTDSNQIFSNVSSGIDAPIIPELNTGNINTYLKQIPVIQKIHNVSSAPSQTYTPLESSVKITDDDYYGDIVEYNMMTVREIVLSDVQYRFNTINRETTSNAIVAGPRPEGYYYKAHHQIKIRDFSAYIEEGDDNTVDKPSYAVTSGDGRYFWRDLLNIGLNDIQENNVNYPFLNNAHYIYQNYCFEVKRQDPFDNWDLYFSTFPADPVGNSMDNKFKINISDNVC
jgi:hypothetical protein